MVVSIYNGRDPDWSGDRTKSGGSGSGSGSGKKKKDKDPVVPTVPLPTTPPPAFNWNSAAGRQPMDIATIMGAAMPLAGQAVGPQHTSPAPPFTGNFWDTVVSPDTMLQVINNAKKDSKSPYGVDVGSIVSGTGKTGSPSQSSGSGSGSGSGLGAGAGGGSRPDSKTSKTGQVNPLMMQMFLRSPQYAEIMKAFAPGGIDPSSMTGGTIPFY